MVLPSMDHSTWDPRLQHSVGDLESSFYINSKGSLWSSLEKREMLLQCPKYFPRVNSRSDYVKGVRHVLIIHVIPWRSLKTWWRGQDLNRWPLCRNTVILKGKANMAWGSIWKRDSKLTDLTRIKNEKHCPAYVKIYHRKVTFTN